MLLLDMNFKSQVVFSQKLSDIVTLYLEFFYQIDLKSQLEELNEFKAKYQETAGFFFMQLKMFIMVCKKIFYNLIQEFYKNFFNTVSVQQMVDRKLKYTIDKRKSQTLALSNYNNDQRSQVLWIVKHKSKQNEQVQMTPALQEQYNQQKELEKQKELKESKEYNSAQQMKISQITVSKQEVKLPKQLNQNVRYKTNNENNQSISSNVNDILIADSNYKKMESKSKENQSKSRIYNGTKVPIPTKSVKESVAETYYQRSLRKQEERKKKEQKTVELLQNYEVNQQFDIKNIQQDMQFRSYNTLHQQLEKRNNMILKSNYGEAQMTKYKKYQQKARYQTGGFKKFMNIQTSDDSFEELKSQNEMSNKQLDYESVDNYRRRDHSNDLESIKHPKLRTQSGQKNLQKLLIKNLRDEVNQINTYNNINNNNNNNNNNNEKLVLNKNNNFYNNDSLEIKQAYKQ